MATLFLAETSAETVSQRRLEDELRYWRASMRVFAPGPAQAEKHKKDNV